MDRRTVTRALAFLAVLWLLDRGLGALLAAGFARVDSGDAGGLINRALAHGDAELVVFGSSRARRHYDPALLERELGLRAYNAGCDGQGIVYARMLERLLLARGGAPRLFVVQADWPDLYESFVARALVFAPFYGEDAVVDELLEGTSSFAPWKLQSRAYRYNSIAAPIVRNWLRPRVESGDGFAPIHGQLAREAPGTRPGVDAGARTLLPEKLALFEAFAADALRQGVRVAFVVGPRLPPGPPASEMRGRALEALAQVASRQRALFLPLTEETHPELGARELYVDPLHLNADGARLFTQRLAGALAEALSGAPSPPW